MNKILVTGLIGSGKSEVCAQLARLGYPVYDSDSRTKDLYEKVDGLVEKVEQAIGVSFSEVKIIFRDRAKREALEAVVYPFVLDDFHRFAEKTGSDTVIFESAVAYGKAQFKGEFDKVVLVRAPFETRLERNPKVLEREGTQAEMPLEEADFIIENNSDLQALYDQVDRMIKTLKI